MATRLEGNGSYTRPSILQEVRESPLGFLFTPRIIAVGIFLLVALPLLMLSGSLVETNNAGWYSIKQAAGTGTMTAYTKPGMFPQNFGDVKKYKAADIVYFSKHENDTDDSIQVRFNDGATAHVSGNVRIDLPSDPEKLIQIHKNFRTYEALIRDTVEQVVSESIILTSALMSAEESYTTKRAEFSQMADDQVKNGVYLTEADTIQTKDPKTGEITIKQIVRIQTDPKTGEFDRKPSVLDHYGIRVSQFVIKEIDYEEGVDNQIKSKQEALMTIVSSKAQAEKAQQQRITAEEEGKMNVAKARYLQEVEKTTAITAAEKELEVAKLGKTKAEFQKQTKILEAEGEGEYRRKIMVADGALQQKLNAYVETQKAWATAMATMQQPLVPGVMMGGTGSTGGNGAMSLMEMMAAKAARDLSIDLKAASKE